VRTLAVLMLLMVALVGCAGLPSSVVQISNNGDGTGFAVAETATAYIVATAAHMVSDGPVIVEGRICTVLAVSDSDDVALVEMAKQPGRAFKVWGISDDVKAGDPVVAMGHVFVNEEPQVVRFPGVVISTNWEGEIAVGGGLFPGMSGGPLVNLRTGKVVGVTSRAADIFGGFPDVYLGLYEPTRNIQVLLDQWRAGAD